MGPKGAAAACRKAATRYQRYSCVHGLGHAYMRLFGELVSPSVAACAALGPADAAACVRGIRVPALATQPLRYQIRLIRGCAGIDHAAQHACYSWLGEALNVIRNGGFADDGCGKLTYAKTRAACTEGARSYEGALQTFS